MNQKITYDIDLAHQGGDKTGLTIKHGDNVFTFIGREAEAIIQCTAQTVKKAEVAARIDELGEVPLDVSVYPELVQYRISRTAHLFTEQGDLEKEDV